MYIGEENQTCKGSIQQEEDSFHQQIDLNLRKELVNCYVWSTALRGAETWTIRTVDQKHLEVLKCGV